MNRIRGYDITIFDVKGRPTPIYEPPAHSADAKDTTANTSIKYIEAEPSGQFKVNLALRRSYRFKPSFNMLHYRILIDGNLRGEHYLKQADHDQTAPWSRDIRGQQTEDRLGTKGVGFLRFGSRTDLNAASGLRAMDRRLCTVRIEVDERLYDEAKRTSKLVNNAPAAVFIFRYRLKAVTSKLALRPFKLQEVREDKSTRTATKSLAPASSQSGDVERTRNSGAFQSSRKRQI